MTNDLYPDYDLPNSNCWAEINLDHLAHNAHALQALGPNLLAVLKADAYGHGSEIVVPAVYAAGVRNFGVATTAEGVAVRSLLGDRPANIHVMTAIAPQDAAVLVEHGLTAFVSSKDALDDLVRAAVKLERKALAHLEIDSGIGRAGILPVDLSDVLQYALGLEHINVTGVCTHFTWGENIADAKEQHALFESTLRLIPPAVLAKLIVHASNSPATINVPGARYGMIRPGLLLYGMGGGDGAAARLSDGTHMLPVLSLRARVLLVRDLPRGTAISYGRTYILDGPARIATIGIGYGDGYPRRLSNLGSVLLADGTETPIRGRICMDQLCIEIPPQGKDVHPGDTVTLVGCSGNSELKAGDIADLIAATPHEITTCLSQRVPRISVRSLSANP